MAWVIKCRSFRSESWLPSKTNTKNIRNFSLYAMILLYGAAGLAHFIQPAAFKQILPPWVPFPKEVVLVSGICEIVLALLLIPLSTRVLAAWVIILFLIAVFPANVQMMLNFYRKSSTWLWLTILRLPVQLLLIYWSYTFTKK
jgi:uncharacterized membrane protein